MWWAIWLVIDQLITQWHEYINAILPKTRKPELTASPRVVFCLGNWEALDHNVPAHGDQAKDWGNEQSNKILERKQVGLLLSRIHFKTSSVIQVLNIIQWSSINSRGHLILKNISYDWIRYCWSSCSSKRRLN